MLKIDGQVIWITGLSGVGKTTLAQQLHLRLQKLDFQPILLDGDELRVIFSGNKVASQSYDRKARVNLALKYSLLCQTLSSQGFTVIISTISMFDEIYAWNRKNLTKYFEIYLKVPLEELYLRDPKSIYQRYKKGKLNNVAGLDLTVDEPKLPDIIYDFECQPFLWNSPKNLIDSLMVELEQRSI